MITGKSWRKKKKNLTKRTEKKGWGKEVKLTLNEEHGKKFTLLEAGRCYLFKRYLLFYFFFLPSLFCL
jgi:hypothetical protein